MAETIKQFAPGGDKKRERLAVAIDVSDGSSTPKYIVAGYGVSDANLSLNTELTKTKDVRGVTKARIEKFEPTMEFAEQVLTDGEDGLLPAKLLHYFRTNQLEKFSNFKVVLIYGVYSEEGPYTSTLYDGSTLELTEVGGENYLGMTYTVHFGGKTTEGTVDDVIGEVTFTPDSSTPSA